MDFGETLVAMTGIILGCSIVIIPLFGLTVRYALKPVVETWARARGAPIAEELIPTMERRIALLERQVEVLERDNARLVEEADFQAKLRAPRELERSGDRL